MTQSHYFKPGQDLDHELKTIEYTIAERDFEFITDRGVFSRDKVDYGTNVMLKAVLKDLKISSSTEFELKEKFDNVEKINCLDLGCGYGVVSIVLNSLFPKQKWLAVDVNPRAVKLVKQNIKLNTNQNIQGNSIKNSLDITAIESDGIPGIDKLKECGFEDCEFNLALLNPPIRTGKEVYYRLFEEVALNLASNGIFYTVIQKKQGSASAIKYLQTLFADVSIIDKSGGYHTIKCAKR